jgi:hypothetical protein
MKKINMNMVAVNVVMAVIAVAVYFMFEYIAYKCGLSKLGVKPAVFLIAGLVYREIWSNVITAVRERY